MALRSIFGSTFYSSGTVTATGDTGVIAVPTFTGVPSLAIFPVAFTCKGASQATDETNDVTIDFYFDSAGEFTAGKITFAQMTAADMLPPPEPWPGDVTLWNLSAAGAMHAAIPLPPYHKITHTLAGTTKSMSYIVYAHYLIDLV